MNTTKRYLPEVKERAVRLVFEHQAEHPSQWAAIASIAARIGCTTETLRAWVRQGERDQGRRAGLTSDERARLKALEFIDAHRAAYGVESICAQLPIAPSQYYEHKAREAQPERLPPRLQRDRVLAQAQCCPNTPRRKIARSIHESARDVARDLAKTKAYQQSRKDRKKVEMLFAHLKRILRLDRLRLRGPNGASDEFLLAATAQNLRRMVKWLTSRATGALQPAT